MLGLSLHRSPGLSVGLACVIGCAASCSTKRDPTGGTFTTGDDSADGDTTGAGTESSGADGTGESDSASDSSDGAESSSEGTGSGSSSSDDGGANCGNGVVDMGEQCDDGNEDDGDACAACSLAYCGDGYVQAGVEECDDGNDVTTDDCLPVFCKSAICTDGYVQEGVEECDDGNQEDGDDCPTSCTDPFCGDGFTWNGMEECDDGDDMAGDGCTPECIAEYCFKIENDGQENLMGNSWFDQCVAAAGDNVMVTLRDANDQVVYTATGMKENNWTNDLITSNAAAGNQYYSVNHNWMINLDNGDFLMITGRYSNNAGCGGSFGNGYGIVIYPDPPNYYSNPKMLVMGYKGGISNQARSFTGWSAGTEISWNNGASMNTCNGVNAFTGSFELSVAG